MGFVDLASASSSNLPPGNMHCHACLFSYTTVISLDLLPTRAPWERTPASGRVVLTVHILLQGILPSDTIVIPPHILLQGILPSDTIVIPPHILLQGILPSDTIVIPPHILLQGFLPLGRAMIAAGPDTYSTPTIVDEGEGRGRWQNRLS
jgi:hypothetical protein